MDGPTHIPAPGHDWLAGVESDPADIVRRALSHFGPGLTISCSFGGAGGMVLLDLAAKTGAQVDVFILDTDFLFPDTYKLIGRAEQRYGLTVRRVKSALTPDQQSATLGPALWALNPDLCCELRKVRPMRQAVAGYAAWMTAVRRDQSPTRAQTPILAWDTQFGLWKICPLAAWTRQQVWDYVAANDVPINPLLADGFTSIGCQQCTARPSADDERSGRWLGTGKIECGIHWAKSKG